MDSVKTGNIMLIVVIFLLVILVFSTLTAPKKHVLSADGKTFEPAKKSSFFGSDESTKEGKE
jgi:hypothetical protein